MEELIDLLRNSCIDLNTISIPTSYIDGERNDEFLRELDGFLHGCRNSTNLT